MANPLLMSVDEIFLILCPSRITLKAKPNKALLC